MVRHLILVQTILGSSPSSPAKQNPNKPFSELLKGVFLSGGPDHFIHFFGIGKSRRVSFRKRPKRDDLNCFHAFAALGMTAGRTAAT